MVIVKTKRIEIHCQVILRGARRIKGSMENGLGIERMWITRIRGLMSSDGINWEPIQTHYYIRDNMQWVFLPGKPIKYVSYPLLAKLSAWFIILGLRPRSPKTRIATACTSGDAELERLRQHQYTRRIEQNVCGISHSKLLIARTQSEVITQILNLAISHAAATVSLHTSYSRTLTT